MQGHLMGTVSKALSLLNLFSHSRREIGLSDMTRLSGLNKATVYRLLSELQSQGFVEQVGADRAYRIGASVLRLAALREASVPLVEVSRKVLADLSSATNETAHMSVLRGDRLSALNYVYSRTHATNVTMENVDELAFHATASGLAVLAYSSPEFIRSTLDGPLASYTDRTVTDRGEIENLLETVRQSGFAESVGGFEDEVHSYAAPVFGPDRHPIGAVAVATPSARMSSKTAGAIQERVLEASRIFTEKIGGFFPEAFPRGAAE